MSCGCTHATPCPEALRLHRRWQSSGEPRRSPEARAYEAHRTKARKALPGWTPGTEIRIKPLDSQTALF